MENCPDKEALEKFVDYGLTEEMNEKILSHLSICDDCRGKVSCLLAEEQELLKSLLSKPDRNKQTVRTLADGCLSNAAILAYAGKCLKEDQLKLVESHLQKCDNCMFELLRVQRLMNAPSELDLDMAVLKEVPGAGKHVLEIVLKAKNDLVELIRHNGELLSLTPQFGAVRGKKEKEERPIVIRKDFQERDLSVEVMIHRKMKESGAKVSVSVMKLSKEKFLSGIDVELSGEEMQQKRTTEDGYTEFDGIQPGTYGIKVGGEDALLIVYEK